MQIKSKMATVVVLCTLCTGLFGTPSNIEAAEKEKVDMEKSPIEGVEFKYIDTNGIRMRIAEMGEGPVVLLVHGWPESWYSWRHQIPALAKAGYRVVVPEMRGYGKTDAPEAAEAYNVKELSADMAGVLDAVGADTATIVGHDWGAIVAANAVLFHPDRFTSLILMSVPYGGRPTNSLMDGWHSSFGENFFYILYHNEPGGIAEKEYDSDPRGILSRLYLSPDSPREAPTLTDPKMSAGGWIPRLGAPKEMPDWLTEADLDYYVAAFEESGFRGGVNYYRNFTRNWELTEEFANAKIEAPTLFIAGEKDSVIGGASAEQLTGLMSRVIPNLRDVVIVPKMGHWIQQEDLETTNDAMVKFLDNL